MQEVYYRCGNETAMLGPCAERAEARILEAAAARAGRVASLAASMPPKDALAGARPKLENETKKT